MKSVDGLPGRLFLFAADCAEHALCAQPGHCLFSEKPSMQWLTEGAIADVRAYVAGNCTEFDVQTFGNALVRPGWPDAPVGEQIALKAAYLALRACSDHAKGEPMVDMVNHALQGIAQAFVAVESKQL